MRVDQHVQRPTRLPGLSYVGSIGAFIWQRPARILAAAARGEPRRTTIECELRGGSMTSAIDAGSRIRITLNSAPYRAGEVVALMDDARLLVHRIVYVVGRGNGEQVLVTRGDAMMLPDAPVDATAVVGRVVAMRDGARWRAIGPRVPPPRRERLLAFAVLVTVVLLAHVHVPSARRFTGWLHAMDRRFSWSRRLVY